MTTTTRTFCRVCDGVGLRVEAAHAGYHIYRQCPTCKGAGYIYEEKK